MFHWAFGLSLSRLSLTECSRPEGVHCFSLPFTCAPCYLPHTHLSLLVFFFPRHILLCHYQLVYTYLLIFLLLFSYPCKLLLLSPCYSPFFFPFFFFDPSHTLCTCPSAFQIQNRVSRSLSTTSAPSATPFGSLKQSVHIAW